MRLDFLIIGAQRARSTYVNECVRAHPDVFSPAGEVWYFDDPHYGRTDPDDIERLFAGLPERVVRGFKRADLLARPECPARIAREAPGVRLVAILRDPVARAVSSFFHYVRVRALPLLPLDEGLRLILDGALDDRHPEAREVINGGLYAKHLERYLEWFDRTSLLILLDEDFAHDGGRAALGEVFAFLGVPRSFEPPAAARRSNAGIYAPAARLRLHRLANRFVYTRDRGSGWLHPRTRPTRPSRISLTRRGASGIVARLDRAVLGPFLSNAAPTLDPTLAAELHAIYEPDRRALETLLGRSLDAWAAPGN